MIRKKELLERIRRLESVTLETARRLEAEKGKADAAMKMAQEALAALEVSAEEREKREKTITRFYDGLEAIMTYGGKLSEKEGQ